VFGLIWGTPFVLGGQYLIWAGFVYAMVLGGWHFLERPKN